MTERAPLGVDDLVPPAKLPYMKGIDGLRAIAVMAVLFYHGDFSWAKGGFLGVEMFFVISGYLITSLLLVEWLRTDTIGIKAFWLRRARRLLPAVFFLLGTVSLMSLFLYRDTLYRLAGDVVASAGYVTNWFLIVKNVSYFETFGRQPFLQHLWSLSVEEQFYVLWPLIFTFGFAVFGRKSKKATIRSFLALTVAGIVASTLLMAVLYTPYEDPSRVYYGTDTRAAGILVGVALSLIWIPWRLPTVVSTQYKKNLNIVGGVALAGLVSVLFMMNEFSPWLYRGGFLLTSLLTAVVIAVTVSPAASLGGILENPVMKWIGLRSYGIYLWHWPIFMITRPGFDLSWHPVPVFAGRLAATFLIAEFSYRYIEVPIRRYGYRAWMANIRARLGVSTVQGGAAMGAAILSVFVALSGGLIWGAVAGESSVVVAADPDTTGTVEAAFDDAGVPGLVGGDSPADPSGGVTADAGHSDSETGSSFTFDDAVSDTPGSASGDASTPDPVASSGSDSPDTGAGDDPVAAADPDPESSSDTDNGRSSEAEAVAAVIGMPSVTIIGDSVLAGAQEVVEDVIENPLIVDATVSRQFKHADDVAGMLRPGGDLGDVVVLHLGTNGAFSDATFDEVIAALDDVKRIIVLTASVPRRWEGQVNAAIVSGGKRWPKVEIVDWHSIAAQHSEYFNADHVHLNREGMHAYAEMLNSVINR